MTTLVEGVNLWRGIRVAIRTYMSLYEREVYTFIYDRTCGWNKEWEDISIRQFMEGVMTGDGVMILPPVYCSKTNLLEALKHLKAKGIIQARTRLGGTTQYRCMPVEAISIDHLVAYIRRHQPKLAAQATKVFGGNRSRHLSRIAAHHSVLQGLDGTRSNAGLPPSPNLDHPPSPNSDHQIYRNNNIPKENISGGSPQMNRKLVLRRKP